MQVRPQILPQKNRGKPSGVEHHAREPDSVSYLRKLMAMKPAWQMVAKIVSGR